MLYGFDFYLQNYYDKTYVYCVCDYGFVGEYCEITIPALTEEYLIFG